MFPEIFLGKSFFLQQVCKVEPGENTKTYSIWDITIMYETLWTNQKWYTSDLLKETVKNYDN